MVAKSQLHLDIETDHVDAEVARLTSLGATVGERQGNGDAIMLDPNGNEFCVIHPETPGSRRHDNLGLASLLGTSTDHFGVGDDHHNVGQEGVAIPVAARHDGQPARPVLRQYVLGVIAEGRLPTCTHRRHPIDEVISRAIDVRL
jgi:Glyoxalase-like domain